MNNLLQILNPKARRGSKPRCHLLTHGAPEQVAARLTSLITPLGVVTPADRWMPQGFDELEEAQLHNAKRLLDVNKLGQALKFWWLAVADSAVTPSWDIASTATIDGQPGLLLVEAKAHHNELKKNDCCSATNELNRTRIGEAVGEADDGLNKIRDGWNLSHENHYQLCNRFAWSWKLATLGIPVILVYLGFINADEMLKPFPDAKSWENAVCNYAKDIVPESVWGSKLMVDNTPIYPLIRSMEIPLDSNGDPIGEVVVNSGTKVYQGQA